MVHLDVLFIVISNISVLVLTLCGTKAIYNYVKTIVADTIIYFFYTKVLFNMICELRSGFSALFGCSGRKISQLSKNLEVTT